MSKYEYSYAEITEVRPPMAKVTHAAKAVIYDRSTDPAKKIILPEVWGDSRTDAQAKAAEAATEWIAQHNG